MELCIHPAQLRRALADIEAAEARGFGHCLAVFRLSSAGPDLTACRLGYRDLVCRAHPSDPARDWGRGGAEKVGRWDGRQYVEDPDPEHDAMAQRIMNKED